jgi:lipoyl(octanoyl) transferase
MQKVLFRDLGKMEYRQAWDYQEELLRENVRIKSLQRKQADSLTAAFPGRGTPDDLHDPIPAPDRQVDLSTSHYLLFVEHPAVYTLGKSGNIENILIGEEEMKKGGTQFFHTNRGGDITFHGPGQLVGYPVLDLEKFYTDIGWYLRSLEEAVILMLAEYGIRGERSPGETGVWIEPGGKSRARKICAIGVRCSRWVTMHGFAFNVNTDLSYFGNIVPCGIQDKQVTSLEKELGHPVPLQEVKDRLKSRFAEVFGVELVGDLGFGV